jgi:heme/copper-type cytochrome/quinol oxidase subunit 3
LGLVYGFVGILQTAALYFAFKISKVKVKGLNDSKYTTAVVYIITILVILLAITSFVFNVADYINVSTSIYGILVWMAGTSTLGLVFIPKVKI